MLNHVNVFIVSDHAVLCLVSRASPSEKGAGTRDYSHRMVTLFIINGNQRLMRMLIMP